MTPKNTLVLSEIYEKISPVTVNFLGNEITGTAKLFSAGRILLEEIRNEAKKLTDEAEAIEGDGKKDKEKRDELIDRASDIMANFNLHILARCYVSLDVSLTSGGEPLPITVENLKHFPEPLLEAMSDALKEGRETEKKMKSSK